MLSCGPVAIDFGAVAAFAQVGAILVVGKWALDAARGNKSWNFE